MTSPYVSKLRLGTICTAGLIVISFLIFRTGLPKIPTFFLYNLLIIIALQSLGFYWAIFFLSASIFLDILASIAMDFRYLWNIPVFFITYLIVNEQIKRADYFNHIIRTRIEEIGEKTNVLQAEYERHKKEATFLEKKESRYNYLKRITSVLSSTFLLEKVTRYILDSALQLVGKSESALLFLVDTEKQELGLVGSRIERQSDRVKAKKGDLLDTWVFKQRQCLLVEDIKKDFRFGEEKIDVYARTFRSVISSPLIEEGKVIGIIRLENSRPHNFTSEDLRLLNILCDLGAVSLQNARLYTQTLELAITDGLTGLYLRRYFNDRVKEELFRSLRNDLECSFLMIDIDNFKNYNDKYGHTAGDIVLKILAKALREFTKNGIVCRYGGEEFCILLPETSRSAARKIAEDIRKAIKKQKIELRRKETHITVSIGVSCFPQDAKVMDELIARADQRLYLAKRHGRDRVLAE